MFGTDGTVTVSGASLRIKKLALDLSSSASLANPSLNLQGKKENSNKEKTLITFSLFH